MGLNRDRWNLVPRRACHHSYHLPFLRPGVYTRLRLHALPRFREHYLPARYHLLIPHGRYHRTGVYRCLCLLPPGSYLPQPARYHIRTPVTYDLTLPIPLRGILYPFYYPLPFYLLFPLHVHLV